MKKITIITIIITLFTLSSCDSFLDIQPKDRVIPTTLEDYRGLLTSAYNYYPTNKSKTELRTDLVTLNPNDNGVAYYKDLYLWKDNEYEEQTSTFDYRGLYKVIFYTNEVIEKGNQKLEESSEKKQLIGEAYALRAYTYFELVSLFAKPYNAENKDTSAVPIILGSDLETPKKPNTLQEVYRQIETDIKQAENLLQQEQATEAYKYRFSKNALNALSAKVALYKGEWQKALEAANQVLAINSELLDLNTNTENQFPNQVKSPENIMALEYAINNDVNRSIFASEEIINLYNKTQDLRYALYYTQDGDNFKVNKGNSKDFKCSFRVGEILLLKAEALIKLSKTEEAKNVIKILAKKRYTPEGYANYEAKIAALSQQALWQELMKERTRELAFEGYHWFDLRRNNQKEINHTFGGQTVTLQRNDPRYTIAFPREARTENPYLK